MTHQNLPKMSLIGLADHTLSEAQSASAVGASTLSAEFLKAHALLRLAYSAEQIEKYLAFISEQKK
jgi:hypothetical protein